MRLFSVVLAVVTMLLSLQAGAQRIKDVASIQGVRSNQLVGYGLVVGLPGTGEQSPFTEQSFRTMLRNFGISLDANTKPKIRNVAAVAVHADLPAFAKPGQTIDITVSSVGEAASLQGGTLLQTFLRGVDGKVYAVAQGSLVVSGFGAQGGEADTINERLGAQPENGYVIAKPIDAASVRVSAPRDVGQRVGFLATLENFEFTPADAPARVVINSRTGTIVIGSDVRLLPAAITHGGLTVTISENQQVSQPNAFGEGQTAVTTQSIVDVDLADSRMFKFEPGVTLDQLVRAVNEVGAAPGDLMAILEALRQAGALRGELVII